MRPSKCRGISPTIFFLRKSIISEFCQKAASRVVPATATAIFASHFDRHDERSRISDIWISAIKFSSDSSHITGDRLVCPLPRRSLAIPSDQLRRDESIKSPTVTSIRFYCSLFGNVFCCPKGRVRLYFLVPETTFWQNLVVVVDFLENKLFNKKFDIHLTEPES